MSKKREKESPTERIERTKTKRGEISFLKFPHKELVKSHFFGWGFAAARNPFKDLVYRKQIKKGYSDVHTHPSFSGMLAAMPSARDMQTFLKDKNIKTMIIGERGGSGKVLGYTFLRKKKERREKERSLGLLRRNVEGIKEFGRYLLPDAKSSLMVLAPKSKKYNLVREKVKEDYLKRFEESGVQYKFVPVPGYEFKGGEFVKKEGLEKRVGTLFLIFSAILILSYSPRMNGFVIGAVPNSVFNGFRIFLFLLSIFLLFVFIWLRRN